MSALAKRQPLLTLGNPKVARSAGLGYLSAILHLAPHKAAGRVSVCPWASPGCIASCLNTAGRGRMGPVQAARVRRTLELQRDPEAFYARLRREIVSLRARAERRGLRLAVRLNGTSDLPWDPVTDIPGVVFYGYTKSLERALSPVRERLVFSRSEKNDASARVALGAGVKVALVVAGATYAERRKTLRRALPWTQGYRCSDADAHDLAWKHPGQCLILSPKGRAKHDRTGFVIR